MVRGALLMAALVWASPGLSRQAARPFLPASPVEPQLDLGRGSFALPVIEHRAPDGSWKRSSGIIVGHDIFPNATVGIGFFRMKPKYQDPAVQAPAGGKSRKVSIGFSLRF